MTRRFKPKRPQCDVKPFLLNHIFLVTNHSSIIKLASFMFHNYVKCATQATVDSDWQAIHVTDSHTYRWQVSEKLPVSALLSQPNGFTWHRFGKPGNLKLWNTFVRGKIILPSSLSYGWKVKLLCDMSSNLDSCLSRNRFPWNRLKNFSYS